MFIANSENYFFEVKCDVDVVKLEGCTIFDTKQAMYEHVSKSLDLTVEELDWAELIIDENKMFGCDWAMKSDEPIKDVEWFINGYIE